LGRLVPGLSCTEASSLENEAPANSSDDITTELIRMAESCVFGSVDIVPLDLHDLAILPWNTAPLPLGFDVTQDLEVLIDGSLTNNQCSQ
jgi:hypothetical protein